MIMIIYNFGKVLISRQAFKKWQVNEWKIDKHRIDFMIAKKKKWI